MRNKIRKILNKIHFTIKSQLFCKNLKWKLKSSELLSLQPDNQENQNKNLFYADLIESNVYISYKHNFIH